MSGKMTTAKAREIVGSLRLAIEAVDRCRELLIYADAEADDLAEYDAAAQALKFTLSDVVEITPRSNEP